MFYFLYVYLSSLLDKDSTKLNIDNLTPSDYTVMLEGIPTEGATEEQIKNEFETRARLTMQEHTSAEITVARFVFAFDIDEFQGKMKKLVNLKKDKYKIDNYREGYKKRAENAGRELTPEDLRHVFPDTGK